MEDAIVRKMFTLALLTLSAISLPMSANAAACKDSKGKFIKCPPAAAAKPTVAAATPKKAVPCKDAKGKFIKCAAPGKMAASPTVTSKAATAPGPKRASCRDAKGRFKKC